MDTSLIFNKNRLVALGLICIQGLLSWYALILLTNPSSKFPTPNTQQLWAILFCIIIAIMTWGFKCTTILARK